MRGEQQTVAVKVQIQITDKLATGRFIDGFDLALVKRRHHDELIVIRARSLA
ncbi:hypothetical protein CA13_73800 [Planctomycetes bacterium CA13]|uniref:Uncharacterized protein n=1 Tax=Novipirellula herctigrandis TaxID=2527986 RepID=A0A5C5YLT1_9BACT|nr:hypothetical protein CA13_73800 [Planctomycetes bacterium CA13]